MISKVSEKTMHTFRWVLAIGWLVLIFSLLFDPISHYLTEPSNLISPFRDYTISQAIDPALCVKVQGDCLSEQSYQIGARIFWGMVIPSAIAIVFVLGHETWRRICPLYFMSQIPRALGLKSPLKIEDNKWLVENHFYLQFLLFFIGLNCRILFVNSDRLVLLFFLLLTIVSAIAMVYLYGGRSWCHYICPFGMVQVVFTGPRGLLDSEAHKEPPRSITQSKCRSIDTTTGQEINACINCKSACFDIDSEKSYWSQLNKPGRKLAQYGYLGMVIGYFIYYFLYSGNFNYYFSGAWSHEENQLGNLFKAGLYIFEQPIPVPKILATPLTLGFFVGITYLVCNKLEKTYQAYLKKKKQLTGKDIIKHRIFSLCTFLAFNSFYIYGGRPEILRQPIPIQLIFNSFIVLVSSFWLQRTWSRSLEQYTAESNKAAQKALTHKNHIQSVDNPQSLEECIYQIDDIRRQAEVLLVQLQVSKAQIQVIDKLVRQNTDIVLPLLRSQILIKEQFVTIQLLKILELLGDRPDAIQLAERIGLLAGDVLPQILQENCVISRLQISPEIMCLLSPLESITLLPIAQKIPAKNSTEFNTNMIDVLAQLLQEPDSLTQAATLYTLYKLNPQQAYQHSQHLLTNQSSDVLVQKTAEIILGKSPKRIEAIPKLLTNSVNKKQTVTKF